MRSNGVIGATSRFSARSCKAMVSTAPPGLSKVSTTATEAREVSGLLQPRSIAVLGASPRLPVPLENVGTGDIPVWGVNPRVPELPGGVKCVASVEALPSVPELGLVLVGHERIEGVLNEAMAFGMKNFVIPGLGNEAGPQADEVASRVEETVTEAGGAFLGPNCMGVARPRRSSPWIGSLDSSFLPGRVSVVVQSGSVGEAMASLGPRVGFRFVVSTGAEASRDVADVLDFFSEDEGTCAVGAFLETVRRPAAFRTVLERLSKCGKPVVCLKVGRTHDAARLAAELIRVLSSALRRSSLESSEPTARWKSRISPR